LTLSQRALSTRDKVLVSAAHVFEQRGYDGAGMAEIILGTGMTRGAVYFHFASKADLASAIVDRHQSTWPSLRDAADREGAQGLVAVHHLLERLSLQLRDDLVARAAVRLAREADRIEADLDSPFDAWSDYIAYRLRQAQLLGQMRRDLDPVLYAGIVVGMFLGVDEFFSGAATTPFTGGVHRSLDAMWEMVLRGLSVAG
jgi:AcrR family transcriptional regulator